MAEPTEEADPEEAVPEVAVKMEDRLPSPTGGLAMLTPTIRVVWITLEVREGCLDVCRQTQLPLEELRVPEAKT